MTMDIMPWLVNMRKLDRYNITQSYDRWAEEVQGLCTIAGVSKAINEKGGGDSDEMARVIIMLSLERDLRDYMSGKVPTGSASELWKGVMKAKKVLEDEAAKAAKSPRINNDFANLNIGGSTSGGGGWN